MAKKMPRSLVALGGSAVAAIYFAGYLATSGADASPGAPSLAAAATTVAPSSIVPTLVPTAPSTGPVRAGGRGDGRGRDDGRQRRERGRFGPGAEAAPGATRPNVISPAQPGTTPAASAPSGARSAQTTAPGQSAPAAASGYRDGTYAGAGTSRRGGFEVAV